MAEAPLPFSDRDKEIARMLLEESDRGCAIFGAQIVCDHLEALLRSIFLNSGLAVKVVEQLFGGYGPLASFSAKVQLAYSLGIVDAELYERIQLVRRIRNKFAHESGPITFDDVRVSGLLERLIGEKGKKGALDGVMIVPTKGGSRTMAREELVSRLAFTLAIVRIAGFIEVSTEISASICRGLAIWPALLRGYREHVSKITASASTRG